MRFSLAVLTSVVVAATWVSAQTLPACTTTCTASADLDGCAATDTDCLCHSQKFIASTAACIASTCKGDELEAANAAARQLCLSVGVTLTSNSAAPTSTTPGGSSAAGGSSAGGSSAPAAGTSAAGTSAAPASTSPNAAYAVGAQSALGLAGIAGIMGLVL